MSITGRHLLHRAGLGKGSSMHLAWKTSTSTSETRIPHAVTQATRCIMDWNTPALEVGHMATMSKDPGTSKAGTNSLLVRTSALLINKPFILRRRPCLCKVNRSHHVMTNVIMAPFRHEATTRT